MKLFSSLALFFFLLSSALFAQTVHVENNQARMSVSLEGGIITRLSLDPHELNPIHAEFAHFICFDRWGPSSQEDQDLGIPFHGNASKVMWNLDQEPMMVDGYYVSEMSCLLPQVNLGLQRRITLAGNSPVFRIVEEITNHNDEARVFNLVQHPTIGAPFLDETTIVDTEADSGFSQKGPLPPGDGDVFSWPDALLDGDQTDLRYLSTDHSWNSAVASYILDDNETYHWITAVNPSRKLMVGFLWPTNDYPWLNLWLRLKNGLPNARGLEFGTTGLHKAWPELLAMETIFGKKLYRELEADASVTLSYYAFVTEVPEDYQGVSTVRWINDSLWIDEYGEDPDRQIILDFAPMDTEGAAPGNNSSNSLRIRNYPNPSNGEAVIEYRLPMASRVVIELIDLRGQVAAATEKDSRGPGAHTFLMDTSDVPAGLYLCRIRAGDQQAMTKMVIR